MYYKCILDDEEISAEMEARIERDRRVEGSVKRLFDGAREIGVEFERLFRCKLHHQLESDVAQSLMLTTFSRMCLERNDTSGKEIIAFNPDNTISGMRKQANSGFSNSLCLLLIKFIDVAVFVQDCSRQRRQLERFLSIEKGGKKQLQKLLKNFKAQV
uniref:CASPASE_P10 domain-containing protein n=1 Tax=Syphacia muris TaxID=451379 RepID=A0A0N5ARZ8_9BILA